MKMRVIAVGTRMPGWVSELCDEYARRLGSALPLSFNEIPLAPRRGTADIKRSRMLEGESLLAQVRSGEYVISLDEHGRELTTRELAAWLGERLQDGRNLSFLIGGPDGHAPEVLSRADFTWSLSKLTLPHALARVLVAEQLYRAHALLRGHPYHRE
jgi:23S rRNA (pseudouridine1915-N3)-methyltransferase